MNAKKRIRIHRLYMLAKNNLVLWNGINRHVIITKFCKDNGVSKKTVIKEYVPIVCEWLKHKHAMFEHADGQTVLSSHEQQEPS